MSGNDELNMALACNLGALNMEQRCCPFLRMTLEIEAGDGFMWLKLGDGENVKAFLRAECSGIRPAPTG